MIQVVAASAAPAAGKCFVAQFSSVYNINSYHCSSLDCFHTIAFPSAVAGDPSNSCNACIQAGKYCSFSRSEMKGEICPYPSCGHHAGAHRKCWCFYYYYYYYYFYFYASLGLIFLLMRTPGPGMQAGGMLPFHVGFSESSAPSKSNWDGVKRTLLKVKTVRLEKKPKIESDDDDYVFKWGGKSEAQGTGPFVDFLAGKLVGGVSVSSVIGNPNFLNCNVPGVQFSGTTDVIIYPSTGESGPQDVLGCIELKTRNIESDSARLQAEKELIAALSFGGYHKFVALTDGKEWIFYTHSSTLVETDQGPMTRLLEERIFVGKEGVQALNAHVERALKLGKTNNGKVGEDEDGGDYDEEKDDASQGDEHKNDGHSGSPQAQSAHSGHHQHISGGEGGLDEADAFDANDYVEWDEETGTALVAF